MFNPFARFTIPLLDAFIEKDKRYFVRQNLPRAQNIIDENIKGYFLISHYEEMALADLHYHGIAHDPNRFLYDWNDVEHRKKLRIAASNPTGYKIYSSVFDENYQDRITQRLKEKIRDYIKYQLRWYPKKEDGVHTDFFLSYGEIFITIASKGREAKVKFEDIEKLK